MVVVVVEAGVLADEESEDDSAEDFAAVDLLAAADEDAFSAVLAGDNFAAVTAVTELVVPGISPATTIPIVEVARAAESAIAEMRIRSRLRIPDRSMCRLSASCGGATSILLIVDCVSVEARVLTARRELAACRL